MALNPWQPGCGQLHLGSRHEIAQNPEEHAQSSGCVLRPQKRLSEIDVEYSPKRLRSSLDGSDSNQSTPLFGSFVPNAEQASLRPSGLDPSTIGETAEVDHETLSTPGIDMENGEQFLIEATRGPAETNLAIDHGQVICYGALCEVKASLKEAYQQQGYSVVDRRFQEFNISAADRCYSLQSTDNGAFAYLDLITCKILRSLDGLPGVSVTAIVETANLMQTKSKAKRTGIIPLSINVYGPLASADQVGLTLSRASAFLQLPFYLEPGCEHFNPQCFRPNNEMVSLTDLAGLTENELRAKAVSDEVNQVFESLDSIGSDLEEFQCNHQPGAIRTELKSHQMDALAFIKRRENHDCCQLGLRDLARFIGILPKDNIPAYSTGGILADIMGLGKTLTMIAAIVATMAPARLHSTNNDVDLIANESVWRSRATLIVVTSMQVLDVWETEISNHVQPSVLKTCLFHGTSRTKRPNDILDNDIVFTTYAILAADCKGQRVLQEVDWYRVILDEAHWIRNQSSQMFRAAKSLKTLRRWCLTGTPIQNSLDDLLSLLKFLHFEPYARSSNFQLYILEPLTKDTPNRAFSLQALLRTICLRRTEKILGLPEPKYEQISVILQPEERSLYNSILRRCSRDADEMVSTQAKIRKYNILFTAIMKLRRLCNHGTITVDTSAAPYLSKPITKTDSDVVFDCEFCRGDDEDKQELVSEEGFCSQCGRSLSLATNGSMAPQPLMASNPWSMSSSTPCSDTRSRVQAKQPAFSTKIQAVVSNIAQLQPSSKSLVFSYWTSTLDLLEHYLQQVEGIRYLRIDGTVRYSERLRLLDEFRGQNFSVLLMSIQTGAVGLNLAVANYVHIVEPQWNPAMEDQAIARAVRLGQSRNVTIIRYVVRSSVEESILGLQKKKRGLAKFTLDSGPGDGTIDNLDDLKFVLNLS